MRLIVTRPEPDCMRTGEALMRLGHVAILSPMLDVTPDPAAAIPHGPFQAVLATSSNAVRALAAHGEHERLRGLPLLAVGDRTAVEARRAGFLEPRSAGGDVAALAAFAAARLRPEGGPLLYLSGDVRAGDLAGALAARGFQVATAEIYRSRPRALSGVAQDALRSGSADGVLLYSRRSAAAFAGGLRAAGLAPLGQRVACYAISAAAADAMAEIATGPVRIADRPDQISLFALLER